MRMPHPKLWWTPKYLSSYLLRRWYSFRHQDEPWMNRRAIKFMAAKIRSGDTGFEWGAGRSTLWLSRRCKQLYSVEHNPQWLANVNAAIARSGLANVQVFYQGDGAGNSESYPSVIDSFEDTSLDFILVDGKARDECALKALPKLKPGSVLIIDDTHRCLPSRVTCRPFSRTLEDGPATQKWAEFLQATQGWTQEWHSDGITATAVFTRPLATHVADYAYSAGAARPV